MNEHLGLRRDRVSRRIGSRGRILSDLQVGPLTGVVGCYLYVYGGRAGWAREGGKFVDSNFKGNGLRLRGVINFRYCKLEVSAELIREDVAEVLS